ncbi:hypothetical protein Aple_071820 [Acrocarpospora pleiomorpha]|uniref:Uncharacterized protein n=1 Tax=Acrocarpospora pleiomorpha TaxID=90975 RepID=A0A5M3XXW6_9ACTN|nr:hypothetical protein [Acrocarpospora pleiomorpha]GES24283.1 hypothetical protein Aple_071820 [Acrocarpospora pleiomorpha]
MIEILKSGVVAGMAVLGLAGAPGVALADGGPAAHDRPGLAAVSSAQASAKVAADGTLVQSKGIKSLTKPAAGVYCVRFLDPLLKVDELTPVATLVATGSTPWGIVMARTTPSVECGNRADTLSVYTGTAAVGRSDLPFYLLIP